MWAGKAEKLVAILQSAVKLEGRAWAKQTEAVVSRSCCSAFYRAHSIKERGTEEPSKEKDGLVEAGGSKEAVLRAIY